jgi:phosphatidylserine decarboxylase
VKVIFIVFQYIIPQHLLSRLVGYLAETEISWLKNLLIYQFIKYYHVNMAEAKDPEPRNYKNFNQFFTRELAEGARAICSNKLALACPADGAISQLGKISNNQIFQAKGQYYSIEKLLADTEMAARYKNGHFATIYLSPKDYHRVHMPLTGTLESMIYVPGQLFSVNQTTAENVPNLFARNERLVCYFATEHGPMAIILVGAMIVAGIETVWSGQAAPPTGLPKTHSYKGVSAEITVKKGDEMGRFKLGSTVILLFSENTVDWKEALKAGSPMLMGEAIAAVKT